MRKALRRAADGLFPGGGNRHDTLPALVVLLTVVTGIVDAVSYLGMDQVFVANMTGNAVFLGFALAGDRRLSAWESLLALTVFTAGAWAAGRLARRIPYGRRTFAVATGVHAVLVAAALVTALVAGHRDAAARAALIVLLGAGMGLQNAAVRGLAIPDLATANVITSTLTGLAAESPGPAGRRRLASIAAMLLGALCGGFLHLRVGPAAALAAALVPLAVATVAAAARPARG
ncbi:YoaK family protein [Streptosporangium sp. NPDC048047]|uniref:YoaK family protein n=1 Tax=Streptosporangium sp. NPDC048047 TaxID=3155748 RepID=UPI00342514CF